jgi:putative NIF3 family GTP cyclohydrolase 1 type 2
MSNVTVGDIERAIARSFPPEWAEEWDRGGLLVGDPDCEVTGVTLALDPTRRAVAAAAERGCNVLVTHHPVFLKAPEWLTPGRGASGVVFSAMKSGVALINAHTNLDRAPAAGALLPAALGLQPLHPIERALMPMTLVTVFTPAASAAAIVSAMLGAGAGRIGEYAGCSYTSAEGHGTFTPPVGGSPFEGVAGSPSSVEELRVEMVAPRGRARGVVAAARAAHPYEEPLVVASDVEIARSGARMGTVCTTPEGLTLGGLAAVAARAFNATPVVWGDPLMPLTRVATATGSAGSLIGDVVACGAQALVAGEVRYHDALDAAENGIAIVELGHDVSEWPLVALLEEAVRTTPGLDTDSVHVLPAAPGWWTP